MHALIATDLSDASLLGVQSVVACGPRVFDRATLLHVVDLDLYTAGGSVPGIIEFAREQLDVHATALRESGIEADIEIAQGDSVQTISRIATERDADMIVMTSLGKGAVTGRVFGSVAEKLAGHGTLPVLVEKVGFGADGAVCRLGDPGVMSRVLLAAVAEAQEPALCFAIEGLPGLGEIRTLTTPGISAADIVAEATDWGATLVAVAVQPDRRFAWSSVEGQVVRQAPCAVLIVPVGG